MNATLDTIHHLDRCFRNRQAPRVTQRDAALRRVAQRLVDNGCGRGR